MYMCMYVCTHVVVIIIIIVCVAGPIEFRVRSERNYSLRRSNNRGTGISVGIPFMYDVRYGRTQCFT